MKKNPEFLAREIKQFLPQLIKMKIYKNLPALLQGSHSEPQVGRKHQQLSSGMVCSLVGPDLLLLYVTETFKHGQYLTAPSFIAIHFDHAQNKLDCQLWLLTIENERMKSIRQESHII